MQIRDAARAYVRDAKLVPPQTLERLQYHARRCLDELQLSRYARLADGSPCPTDNAGCAGDTCAYEDFTVVMLNNALWETCFAHIPKERRLLLLPFCLRNYEQCEAPRDELGLICNTCGKCDIPNFSQQADNLGMPVLVAETSAMVAEWVRRGEIQAVVGVSCLDSLRKAWPSLFRHAIPGIAVPLTKDGCRDSEFDQPFLNDTLALADDAEPFAVPNANIQRHIKALFTKHEVDQYVRASIPGLSAFPHEVEHALCAHGKHYRPMIVLGTYCALTNRADFPDFLNPIALAVECFHKASLIHDDIEDGDETRYDEPTLHRRVGIPTAMNVGDYLIGEGYRLLGHPSIPGELHANLCAQAAQAHCELSLGQAQEFERSGKDLTREQCLETHRLKTAPAFRVALSMGAIAAGKFAKYQPLFHEFADLFGVSYQLQDDLEDTGDNPASAVDSLMRQNNIPRDAARAEIATLYETYRSKTYQVLESVTEPPLKIFMYRLIGKVLNDV